jgi:S-formylglutathione hydrolase FrmB
MRAYWFDRLSRSRFVARFRKGSRLLLLLTALAVPLALPQARSRHVQPVQAKIVRLRAPVGVQAHGATLPRPTGRIAPPVADAFHLAALKQAQRGYSFRVPFHSAALGRTMHYWVYLPPDYDRSDQRYPVLYMLHGLNGNSLTWRAFGFFDQADRLIRDKQIAPLIIVTPQGDNGYWMNHIENGPRYEDYMVDDVVMHVDTTFRTLAAPEYRAIGGVSMGGHGAIRLMLTHPDLFTAAGGHSPVFRDQQQAFPFYGTGRDYQQRDPVSLVQELQTPVSGALYIDMGLQDTWLPRTRLFHELLVSRGVEHVWLARPGDHVTEYWVAHVPEYLRWYDAQLRGKTALPGKLAR